MAKYQPKQWKDKIEDAEGNVVQEGTPILARDLQNIETGIVNVDSKMDGVTQQLADTEKLKADKIEVQTGLNTKRDKSVPIGLNDTTPEFLAAIEGGEGTSFNLESIPRDRSVTPEKTTFLSLSNNLFNENDVENGYIDASTGVVLDSESYATSAFVKVVENTTYSLTSESATGYGFNMIGYYRENQSFIRREYTNSEQITTPTGTAYIKVAGIKIKMDGREVRINTGNSLLAYEPYYLKLKANIEWDDILNKKIDKNGVLKGEVSGDLIDFDFTNNLIKVNYVRLSWNNKNVLIQSELDITSIGQNDQRVLYFDEATNTVKSSSVTSLSIPETGVVIGVFRKQRQSVWGLTNYKINGVDVNLFNKIGLVALSNVNKPTIDLYNKKVIYYKSTRLLIDNTQHTLATDVEVGLSSTSLLQYVLFDTSNLTFRLLVANNEGQIRKTESIVMIINFTAISQYSGSINYVFSTCGYTVKTERDLYIHNREVTYRFVPEDIIGIYESKNESHTDFQFDPVVSPIQNYYDAFNDVVSRHPDYVIATNLGNDSTDSYPVYQYHFKPDIPSVVGRTQSRTLPKITIVCGLHGREKSSIFSLYYLMRDVMDNWKSDPLLEYLRHNVEIVMIPVANPWSYMNNTRTNSNGVDLNRNFELGWELGDPTSEKYGGSEPFSEIETVYVKNMFDEHADAMIHIDYHTNDSTGDNYNKLLWYSLYGGVFWDEVMSDALKYQLGKMTREFIRNYNQPNDVGYLGYIDFSLNTAGVSNFYAMQKGVPSVLVEGFRKFPDDVEYYNDRTIKANTENIGNWLLTAIKTYKG